jgi:hypothetical protein
MKHFISQKQHAVIGVLLVILVIVVVFFVIKSVAQCAPDDLGCLSMP